MKKLLKNLLKKVWRFFANRQAAIVAQRSSHIVNPIIVQQIIASIHCEFAAQMIVALVRNTCNVRATDDVNDGANVRAFLNLVHPAVSSKINLVRVGGKNDGGYLMLPPPIIRF